ncbi:hypothetical protein [Bradyrhizobium sp. USDA 4486]
MIPFMIRGLAGWNRIEGFEGRCSCILNQKFAASALVLLGRCDDELLDRSKRVSGGFCPSEGFAISVVSLDERDDVSPERGYAAINLAA